MAILSTSNGRYAEITGELRGKAIVDVSPSGNDFFWTDTNDVTAKDRFRPFSLTCKEPMELRVIYWDDRPMRDFEPDILDNTNSLVVHFTEGSNSHRLFKIVHGPDNTITGGTEGEIVANR